MKPIEVNLPILKKYRIDSLIIGHFNLLHLGHYKLFKNLKNFSFLIFKNNPSKTKTPYTLSERIENLSKFKPQRIFVYDILKNNISANNFITDVLLKLNPQIIIVGSDFCFGKNKSGDIVLLKKFFDVRVICKNDAYSSRKIINLIENGKLSEANKMMLFNFYYSNKVIKGKGLASKFNTQTANIEDNKKIKIPSGSYASVTVVDNIPYKSISFIGVPKSFETTKPYVETHLFDFKKNIYGKNIRVYPLYFIRPNQKFNDISLLVKAINSDCNEAKNYLEKIDIKKLHFV